MNGTVARGGFGHYRKTVAHTADGAAFEPAVRHDDYARQPGSAANARARLSATQDEISWVITLNLVATAVATPLTGWVSSRVGWRNIMFFTVLGFVVSSFLCGIAGSLEELILARVAQGIFGAPIMPMGQAIILATFPPHLQPFAIVMWGVGAVFGPVLGPILGAIATEAFNWRAAFFMIIPPGIVALVCIWFALSEYTERSRRRSIGRASWRSRARSSRRS